MLKSLRSFWFGPILFLSFSSFAAVDGTTPIDLKSFCIDSLKGYRSYAEGSDYLAKACEGAQQLVECESVDKTPIYHVNRTGDRKGNKNILVFSLIHGDETHAGAAARFWMERLQKFDPRNNWRIVPVLNPDGVKLHTRTNANKIDLNRNFPTKDWDTSAVSHWRSSTKSNPRRFPGNAGGSEPETKCAVKHIEDFRPDFVISIHTPLKVLDFDGPRLMRPPRYDYLPWKALGHYPGSLGRFLWYERKVPTLTMELREDLPKTGVVFEQIQDIIGTLVLLDGKR